MMRFISLFILAIFSGCTAPYQVIELTDKFTDPNAPAVFSMVNNSIDFSDPMGLVRFSTLNGYVMKDRKSGEPTGAGFYYNRIATDADVSFRGEPKWLSVRAGGEAVFLADGERIVLKARANGRIDHQTTRGVGYSVNTDYSESVDYPATIEQFRKIAFARKIEFQFSGNNGAVSYPRKNYYALLESFQQNLRQFHDSQIAGKKQ